MDSIEYQDNKNWIEEQTKGMPIDSKRLIPLKTSLSLLQAEVRGLEFKIEQIYSKLEKLIEEGYK